MKSNARFAMLLIISLVPLSSQPLWASKSPTRDEVDEVVKSSKLAVEIINRDIKSKYEELASLIAKLQASVDQLTDSSRSKQLNSIIQRVTEACKKLSAPIGSISLEDRIEAHKRLTESLRELDQARALGEAQINETKNRAEKEREAAWMAFGVSMVAAGVTFGLGAISSVGVGSALSSVSKDRPATLKFVELIHSGNKSALADMLKRSSLSSDVDLREVKDTEGLMLIFRLSGSTHCFSTRPLCNGRAYSATK